MIFKQFLVTVEEIPPPRLLFTISPSRKRIMATVDPVVFQLRDDEEFDLSFRLEDRVGNPLLFDPSTGLNVSISDPTVLSLTDKGNGLFTVSSVGKIATAQVNVKATVSGRDINGSLTVDVVAGDADHIDLVPSTPRLRTI